MKNSKSTKEVILIQDEQIQKMFEFNNVCLKGIILFSIIQCILIATIVS